MSPGISIRSAQPADREFVMEIAARLASFDVPAWRDKPEQSLYERKGFAGEYVRYVLPL